MIGLLLAIAACLAAGPSRQEKFATEVARRSLAGLQEDLAGPCLSQAEAGKRTLAWGPYGERTVQVIAQVSAEMHIKPGELAQWSTRTLPGGPIPELAELDALPRAYAARCFPTSAPLPPPAASPAWGSDLDAAFAQMGHRRILLRFYAVWSAADAEMDSLVWSDPHIIATVERCFVPVSIDISERDTSEEALVRSLGVKGIPAWIVLDGPSSAVAPATFGYQTTDAVVAGLTALCPP